MVQRRRIDRNGQPDAIPRIPAAQLCHRQPGLPRQGLSRIKEGPSPRGQEHLARLAPGLRHPFRKGFGQQGADIGLAALTATCRPGPSLRQSDRVACSRRPVALQTPQPIPQIKVIAAEPRLAQHRRDPGPEGGIARIAGDGDHMRQPRRQRDPRHPPSMGCQRPGLIQRTQSFQHLARLGERPRRRLVQQGEPLCRPGTPSGQVEGKARQVRLQDFRPLVRHQPARLRLVPKAVAHAGFRPSGPAAPLFCRGPADPDRRQPRQAAGRLEPRHARQATVDHHPDPLDGQAGLGHRGRQHHLAPPGCRRLDGPILGFAVQRPVQRNDINGRIIQPLREPLRRAVDFALSGQKDEDRAALLPQGQQDGPGQGILDPLDRVAPAVTCLDRKHPPLGLDHGRAVQKA